MILNVIIDGQNFEVTVPDFMMEEANEMFDKMDVDMSKGWQMGRIWIDSPTTKERCQIAADKLMTAIESENQNMATMMAAYIMKRMPGAKEIVFDDEGDMLQTEIFVS
ncbi:MAG: hypothetical protein HUJ30_03090 [Gammaproteobacteria bacterium]|nr:hypothetical protein [Gammaproteobacteria bacterium]